MCPQSRHLAFRNGLSFIPCHPNQLFLPHVFSIVGLPGSAVKNPPANAGGAGLIPGSGRSPGDGNGNPLQFSCLENLMDRGAWRAKVRRVAKRRTRLKQLSMHSKEYYRRKCLPLTGRETSSSLNHLKYYFFCHYIQNSFTLGQ